MKKISLDDCGQVMPADYWHRLGKCVWAVMVIKAPSGEHLAITLPEDSTGHLYCTRSKRACSTTQLRAVKAFMKRNNLIPPGK